MPEQRSHAFRPGGEPCSRARGRGCSDLLAAAEPTVIALGGGAVLAGRPATRCASGRSPSSLEVEPDAAWERIARVGRPLAKEGRRFRALYLERPACLRRRRGGSRPRPGRDRARRRRGHVQIGALDLLADLVPGYGTGGDRRRRQRRRHPRRHGALALGDRDVAAARGAAGRGGQGDGGARAALARVAGRPGRHDHRARRRLRHRSGRFCRCPRTCAASTGSRCRRRSSARWTPRSAARPQSTCRRGKNLVGAFHWPARVIIDPGVLETLPDA